MMVFRYGMLLCFGIALLTACSAAPHPPAPLSTTTVIVPASAVPPTATPPLPTAAMTPSSIPLTPTPRPTRTTTPTATPIPQVEWLPLTQEWVWNLNTAGTCGYPVTTRSMTETVAALPEVIGIQLRVNHPPLLFTCASTNQAVTLKDPITEQSIPIQNAPNHFYHFFSTALSPDERYLAVSGYEQASNDNATQKLYALDSRTGEMAPLFEVPPFPDPQIVWDYAQPLAWRADGLYFLTVSSGNVVLWRAILGEGDVEITEVLQMSMGSTYPLSLSSPQIAYTQHISSTSDVELHILNPVTGADIVVAQAPVYSDLVFNAAGDVLYYLDSSSPNIMAYALASQSTSVVEAEDPIRGLTFSAYNAPLSTRFYRSRLIYQP